MKKSLRLKFHYGHAFQDWEIIELEITVSLKDYFRIEKAKKTGKAFFECKEISDIFKKVMEEFYEIMADKYKKESKYDDEVRNGLNIKENIPLSNFTDSEKLDAFKTSICGYVDF